MIVSNPFDTAGFSLSEMTRAIEILPNLYGRIGQLGLFEPEPITQRSVVIEQSEGTLALLPSVAPGGPSTVGDRDSRAMRSFTVPHIPHDDVILPDDIQGVRAFGEASSPQTLATVMARILRRMRQKHAQTLEFMRLSALKGVTRDGRGAVIYDWFSEFDIARKTIDFKLGDANTDVPAKCRELLRYLETNLKGEVKTGVRVLVGPGFWDRLIAHKSVIEAYKYYAATVGLNPMRQDTRQGFTFHGVTFEEYDATFTLFGGKSEPAFADKEGTAFPIGTIDTFRTYFAPANLMDTVNTFGLELYARQMMRPNGSAVDVFTESNPLPIVKRPGLCVKITTSG